MLTVIKVDGSMHTLIPKNAKVSLQELQTAVGGYVEVVDLDKKLLVIDEEGKLKCKRKNEKATVLFQEACGDRDFIVGDVILCDVGDIE